MAGASNKKPSVHSSGLPHGDRNELTLLAKKRASDNPSEDRIARYFEQKHKGNLLYCHDRGVWFRWNGNYWVPDETQLVFDYARTICREVNKDNKNTVGKASTATAVLKFAQASRVFAVTSQEFDSDPYLLGTPGGTIDLRTGTLRKARREDHITKQTTVTPDPEAEAPLWHKFLDEATNGDQGLQRFLAQMGGYCLTGDTREHALFFIYGPGGNGKTVFLNTTTNVMGDYAKTSAMDTFTASRYDRHPTELAMLQGARLVSVSETEEGRAWAETRIKQVTGGDKIAARYMRQDFFEYQPQFKPLVIGNYKPLLNNVDEAMRRRVNIIPFLHEPPQPDKELEAKLKAEYPAILQWMINGCLDWQDNGLVRPQVVRDATDTYFEDQDLFGQWLEEQCEKGPGKFETFAGLFKSWRDYAELNGEKPGSSKAFSQTLAKQGFAPDRRWINGKTQRVFMGVALLVEADYIHQDRDEEIDF